MEVSSGTIFYLPSKKNAGVLKQYSKGIPLAFQRKHLESEWNFDGFPLEYHQNTAADFVQIYRTFSRIISMKYHSFFGGKNRKSYGILVVFWWNFCGIF